MNRFNAIFGFTDRQLRALAGLGVLAVLSLGYILLDAYTLERPSPEPLTIYVGGEDQTYRPILLLDINHSPADSLELLPGIGSTLAGRIVAYRDSVAPFVRPSDIINVPGIGPSLYGRIKPFIRVTP